jgi:phosphoglycerate kinase
MKKNFLTLDDVDVRDKTVLVRVDINVPYDEATGKISDSERLREHAKTIKELSDKGAKIVVLAHQGRKGDPDFIHLEQHAELLSIHVGKPVQFVADVISGEALEKIKLLKPGDILLLDNVRFLDEETEEKTPEEHANSRLVQTLAPLADIFVNDAFSAAHRSHASIVGFTVELPSVAGRVMEKEITSSDKVLKPKHPTVYVLGGAKPDDCLNIMKYMLEKKTLDTALTCGTVGELFLLAKGYDLGKATMEFFEKKGFTKLVADAKELLEKYRKKIKVPVDVAVEENGMRKELPVSNLPVDSQLMDIGSETAKEYGEVFKKAKTIVVKGPAGVYEKPGFEIGTKMVLDGVAETKAFSLICGGDTTVAMEKLGIDKSKFSYISIAGGALITYLSGKPLPGVEALRNSAIRNKQL